MLPPLPCPARCQIPRGTHSLQTGPRPRPGFREGQEPCSGRPRAGVGLGVCSVQLRSRSPAQTSLRTPGATTRTRSGSAPKGSFARGGRPTCPGIGPGLELGVGGGGASAAQPRPQAARRVTPPGSAPRRPAHAPRRPAHAQSCRPPADPPWRPSGSRAGPPASSWPAAPRKVRLATAGSGPRALRLVESGPRWCSLRAGQCARPPPGDAGVGGLPRGPAVRGPRPAAGSRVKVRGEPGGRAPPTSAAPRPRPRVLRAGGRRRRAPRLPLGGRSAGRRGAQAGPGVPLRSLPPG